jgi:hypothetical protein
MLKELEEEAETLHQHKEKLLERNKILESDK